MLGHPKRPSIVSVCAFPVALVATAFFGPSVFAQRTDANYDESKVGQYHLPDPLVTSGGRKVTTSAEWFQERRPELLRL
ncbi:MAG TPA: hypothetical protein VFF52_03995, partial [Isosphaeraceae bacterium]|nr:hypothetical protein [Isosphaeraceae bacterium]